MNLKDELNALLSANVPLIYLVTYEEERVIRALDEIATVNHLGLVAWDVADGFSVLRQGQKNFPVKDLTSDTLLPHLAKEMPESCVVVLKDFHLLWGGGKQALATRRLRNMAPVLRKKAQYLVITAPERAIPLELKDAIVALDVPLPDAEEMAALFEEQTQGLPKEKLPRRAEEREKIIASALGLTSTQARLAFSLVWAALGKFDDRAPALVTRKKQEVIRDSGALEFWPPETSESSVGGLDLLKDWLAKREKGFSAEAREHHIPYPKGVALIGIPGTGKSLSAKLLSGLWKLPLLRLDVAALFGSLLGESERNLRQAIQLAETVSPCILWVDEIEKAFAGAGAGSLNAGAATRVFGSFLTWMQERRSPVFVIATANDVSALPVELMGRFDRVFFLDLPNDAERRAIFRIHLERAGETFPERRFDFAELVEKSRGFVGREIERVVREAQFTAFADGQREIEQDDLLLGLKEVVPLSKSHAEAIEVLRRWKTEGRAFPASSPEVMTASSGGRRIEIPDLM